MGKGAKIMIIIWMVLAILNGVSLFVDGWFFTVSNVLFIIDNVLAMLGMGVMLAEEKKYGKTL